MLRLGRGRDRRSWVILRGRFPPPRPQRSRIRARASVGGAPAGCSATLALRARIALQPAPPTEEAAHHRRGHHSGCTLTPNSDEETRKGRCRLIAQDWMSLDTKSEVTVRHWPWRQNSSFTPSSRSGRRGRLRLQASSARLSMRRAVCTDRFHFDATRLTGASSQSRVVRQRIYRDPSQRKPKAGGGGGNRTRSGVNAKLVMARDFRWKRPTIRCPVPVSIPLESPAGPWSQPQSWRHSGDGSREPGGWAAALGISPLAQSAPAAGSAREPARKYSPQELRRLRG